MRTLYESTRVTVIHGLAEEVMPTIATESVDLVVTDPPYGVSQRSNRREQQFDYLLNDGADDRDLVADVVRECVRIVGQNRHLYVFGPDDVMAGLKVSAPATLIWDKTVLGSGDMTSAWGPAHEPITFAVSKHRHAGEMGKEGVPTRLRKGSVLRFSRPTGRKVRHPSEKPVALLRELIESSSRQGDLVVDPFAGVGSTGVAAVLAGRRALLIEAHEPYALIAAQRIQDAEAIYEKGLAA